MFDFKKKRAAAIGLTLVAALAFGGCGAPGLGEGNRFGLDSATHAQNDGGTHAQNNAATDGSVDSDAVPGTMTSFTVPSDAIYAELAKLIGQSWNEADEIAIELPDTGSITISEPGTYRLSGTMSDGSVVVDVAGDEPVRLILDDAHLTNLTGSPLAILNANGGAAIVLAQGSHNSLTDAAQYADTSDDAPNATLFADDDLAIFGSGSLDIVANFNDGINFNDGLVIDQAMLNIRAVDDGISGNDFLAILGGNITITESEEGLEAAQVHIAGGVVNVTSSDDGVNASSDDENAELLILVSGGTLTVTADGDGIDSNGAFRQIGGDIIVQGPTGNGDGALDADHGLTFDGGTMFAVGSAGMLVTPQAASAQSWLVTPLNTTVPASTTIEIKDAAGNVIASLVNTRAVAAVTYSGPALVAGETYTILANGTEVGSVTAGVAASRTRGRGPGDRGRDFPAAPGSADGQPSEPGGNTGRNRPRR